MNPKDILADLTRLGVRLETDGERLLVWPSKQVPRRLIKPLRHQKGALIWLVQQREWHPELAERLDLDIRSDVTSWLDGPDAAATKRGSPWRHRGAAGSGEPTWPGWLADFVLLLTPDHIPDGLLLNPWTTVTDPAKCLTYLQADIRKGARGPRAAVLGDDLEELRQALLAAAEGSMQSIRSSDS